MTTVITYEDAKANQVTKIRRVNEKDVGTLQTPFLGSRENPDLPFACLEVFSPRRCSSPHFHDVDQFQIMIAGKGKMGRHDIAVNSVHFSRSYTPYGPLIADAETGLTCMIIRPRPGTRAQHSREAIANLRQIPDRHPWQITRDINFPLIGSSSVVLQPVSEIQDENGLATYTLSMNPNSSAFTPDPSRGNGLFVVVLKGSLLHDNKEANALTLVYVSPKETKFEICAGSGGLEGLIVQFARAQPQLASGVKEAERQPRSKAWQCLLCSFVYDEAAGLPAEGIAPGTRWEDLPASWTCPDCAAEKHDFDQVVR